MRIAAMLAMLVLGALNPGRAFAWGAEGHEYTGAIADQLLNDNARRQVQSLLGFTLQTASTWPDCVRSVVHTGSGSFVFTEDPRHPEYTASCTAFETPAEIARMEDYAARNWTNCFYETGHGCHEAYHFTDVSELRDRYDRHYVGTNDHDVVSAIGAAVALLQGQPVPAPFSIKDGKEALFMIAHFVGDLHQPLHVGAVYLALDGTEVDPDASGAADPATTTTIGGNAIRDGQTNLHAEWDAIPPALGTTPDDAAVHAAQLVPPTAAAPADMAAIWATDTVLASHDAFAGLSFQGQGGARPPYHWSLEVQNRPDYLARKQDLQEKQLVKGGARLAALLNAIWP